MKRLTARLRAWETELHRWNSQRVVLCKTCGPLRGGRRLRTELAYWFADHHEWAEFKTLPGDHHVKVRRFG